MNIAFIHDHKFIEKKGQFFTTGDFNKEMWDIYLNDNDNLFVFARKCLDLNMSSSISSSKNVLFNLSRIYFTPLDFFLKYRNIKKELELFFENKDCVIIRLPSFLGLIAVEICKQRKLPYAVEVVGNVYDSLYNYNLYGKLIAKYIHNKVKKAIFNAPKAIYVTRFYLQKIYPCNNSTEFASDVHINEDKEFNIQNRISKIELLGNNINIGQIGHIDVTYKGYEMVFQLIQSLKKTNKNINIIYLIAGSGEGNKLRKLTKKYGITQNVKYVGKLDKKGILKFLDKIDIYVHPSLLEGLSRAIIEALSRGCPILASNVGGAKELLDENYLHNPKDIDKFINDFNRIISNKNELKLMSVTNYNKSKQYYYTTLQSKRRLFWDNFYNSFHNCPEKFYHNES